MKDPSTLLAALHPVLAIVEDRTGLPAYKGGEEGLAFVGMLLFILGEFPALPIRLSLKANLA
jgi:hypothetical protein